MLGVARGKNIAGVEWRQADATALPFPDASFAAVACQFGVMFVPPEKEAAGVSRDASRTEARRLARLQCVGLADANPFARVSYETMLQFFPKDPPSFYQVPFGFHDAEVLRGMLAGFTDIAIERVKLPALSETARSFAIGLVTGNPIITAIEERGASPDAIVEANTAALVREGGDNPYRSTMQAVVVTARA